MGMYCDVFAVTAGEARRLLDDPESMEDFESPRSVNLEKAWHGLHYLLTGDAWDGEAPLNFLVVGGQPIGDVDFGYGPARLLNPAEVQSLADALLTISDDQLWSRFDAEKLTEEQIYPLIWDEPAEDLREEYLMYFHDLKTFVSQSAAEGMALILRLV
jgi:hypothetical protein